MSRNTFFEQMEVFYNKEILPSFPCEKYAMMDNIEKNQNLNQNLNAISEQKNTLTYWPNKIE